MPSIQNAPDPQARTPGTRGPGAQDLEEGHGGEKGEVGVGAKACTGISGVLC